MPVPAIYDNRSACIGKAPFLRPVGVLELRSRLLENLCLYLFTLLILTCEILCGPLGLGRIVLKEELERVRRIVKPSCRIDPRHDVERDKGLIKGLARVEQHLVDDLDANV